MLYTMPAKPDAYYRPPHLAEALQLLQKPDVVPLAGGTSLLASEEGLPVAGVVDLQDLGLNQLDPAEDQLRLGAMVRLAELDEFLTTEAPYHPITSLLRRAIHHAGPNTYRNVATVGGIIAGRLPDSELLAALLALEAGVEIGRLEMGGSGDWEIERLEDYLGMEERPRELITAVIVPWVEGRGGSERVARTPADYPIVSVTAWQPAGQTPRLAATGVAVRPVRLPGAEGAVASGLNEQTVRAAAVAAKTSSNHAGDFRGDAAYRAEMAAVLTHRLLASLG
jgi:CO/xanthine dehydrogenase FAD-binding subunit